MAKLPPWPIPPQSKGSKGPWEEVAVNPYSDGNVRYWPGKPLYRPIPESHYLIVLATFWVKAKGLDQPDTNYYLDKLPDGYKLFEMDGPGPNITYKRLFGHPGGRYYDSAIRYQPHFLWLMGGMEGNCECHLCTGKKKPPVARESKVLSLPPKLLQPREVSALQKEGSSVRSKSATGLANERVTATDTVHMLEKRQLKPPDPAIAVDEEGTEDIVKAKIMELSKFRHLKAKDALEEKYSMDYQAERKCLPTHLTQISLQHSFVPRIGELVLWCPYFPDELDLIFNPDTGFYQFYSFNQGLYLGFPNWHGGVVAAVPSSAAVDGAIDFPDILSNPKKKSAYNTSGFRVETFPDPNNDTDKSLSKQYKYIPLRQIRPLSHWQTLLRGIPERKLDPSIKHALTGMTTVSLLEKFRFTADWPNATIHCRGIYLGAELILVGDAVRILPVTTHDQDVSPTSKLKDNRCTDVLVISSIRLNLYDITNEHALPHSPHLSTHSSITLVGKAYTLDPRRDYRIPVDLDDDVSYIPPNGPEPIQLEDVKSVFPTIGAKQYGDWFPVHAPQNRYEISFEKVLGRMYEAGAVRLWTGMSQTASKNGKTEATSKPTLNQDLSAVLAGRRYATQTDERIHCHPSGKIAWFWADTRVQALNIETFNGHEVGAYDMVRDKQTLRSWRAMLRVLDGTATVQDMSESGLPKAKGRRKGARLVDGKIVYPGEEGDGDGDDSGGSEAGLLGKKKDRSLSMVGAQSGSQGSGLKSGGPSSSNRMLHAGLEDEESEDESSDGVTEGAPSLIQGGQSGELDNIAMSLNGEPPQKIRPQTAKKRVDAEGKPPALPRTKAQIMRFVNSSHDDGGDEDDDDDDDDEEQERDYDEEILQDLEKTPPPFRGGTEESEGGDYNPSQLLEIFQRRKSSRSSSSGPKEKKMRY